MTRTKAVALAAFGFAVFLAIWELAPALGFMVLPGFLHQGQKDIDVGPITDYPEGKFVITTFTSGPGSSTLPLYIFGSLRIRVTPDLNAISALMLGASFLLLTLGALIAIGRERLRGRAGVVGKIPFAEETSP